MAYVFNNDLLIGDADIEEAKRDFPNVAYALHHGELNEIFQPIDRRANAAKRKSRQWGVLAVFLATMALMLAAGEVLYHDFDKTLVRALAAVGAIAGISSVFIGVFGVMFRARKMQWLADRLTTERLRQFHFQHYVAHAPEILAGARDEQAARAYLEKRARDFAAFKADFVDKAEEKLCHLVEADDPGLGLLFAEREPPVDPKSPHLKEYLLAYRILRFDRQIGYCNLMLREKGVFWVYAPLRQAKIMSLVATVCVFAILFLHALVFIGALADIPDMKSPAIHVAAIWSAIVALAARTIEEGFQPETEVERLRQYRLSLRRIFQHFNADDDPAEKLEAMVDLEKLAFQEMTLFLRGNYEAQYVM